MGPTPLTREVIGRIEVISRDRVHGATFLAAEALRALALAAEAQPPGDGRVQAATEAARRLADARPAIAAIKNIARRFVQRAEASGGSFDSDALAGELLAEMKTASREAARKAAELVDEGARVLTCSYSSAVLHTFQAALASSKGFRVTAVESRTGGIAYGPRVVDELSARGMAAELLPDHAIAEGVAEADLGGSGGSGQASPGWGRRQWMAHAGTGRRV